jgi:hypothetical protein
MGVAAIDPQTAPLIAALATLATALGLSERRRRSQARARPFVGAADLDRQAAETILTQWKAVLEATQARADWETLEHQRCEERNVTLERRIDELEGRVRAWLDAERQGRRRRVDGAH